MASERKLRELLAVAKNSRSFAGMKEDDVWQACLVYREKSDAALEKAMANIQKKDAMLRAAEEKKRGALERAHEVMMQIRKKESGEQADDDRVAEELLKGLMPVEKKRSWWVRLWEFLTKKL